MITLELLATLLAAFGQAEASAVGGDRTVELMVMTEVNADRSRMGDPVKFIVNHSVKLGDGTIVPVGTPGFGEIVSLKPSGMAMQRGALSIRFVRLSLNGRDIPLAGGLTSEGRGGKSDDALQVTFAPMYAPFARGHSAKFKAGELVVAHLAEPETPK